MREFKKEASEFQDGKFKIEVSDFYQRNDEHHQCVDLMFN